MTVVGRARAETAATPQRVWDVLADTRTWHTWNAALEWAVCEGALAPGGYVTIKPRRGHRQTAYRIAAAEAPRRLAIGLTFGPLAELRQTWTIDANPSGSAIACEIAIGGPLAGVLVRTMARRAAAALPDEVARLAVLAAE